MGSTYWLNSRRRRFRDPVSGREFGDMIDPARQQQIAATFQAQPNFRGFKAAARRRRGEEHLPEFTNGWVEMAPGEVLPERMQLAEDDDDDGFEAGYPLSPGDYPDWGGSIRAGLSPDT